MKKRHNDGTITIFQYLGQGVALLDAVRWDDELSEHPLAPLTQVAAEQLNDYRHRNQNDLEWMIEAASDLPGAITSEEFVAGLWKLWDMLCDLPASAREDLQAKTLVCVLTLTWKRLSEPEPPSLAAIVR